MTDEYTPGGGTTPTEDEARAEAQAHFDQQTNGAWLSWPDSQKADAVADFIAGYLAALSSRVSTPPSTATALRHAALADEIRGQLDTTSRGVLDGLLKNLAAHIRRLSGNSGELPELSRIPEQLEPVSDRYKLPEVLQNTQQLDAAKDALTAWDEASKGGTPHWRIARTVAEALRELLDSAIPPTDEDEREALGFLIRDIYRERGMYTPDQEVADAILAAGFRRQAVTTPEPECEQCRWDIGFGAREPLGHTCGKTPPEGEA